MIKVVASANGNVGIAAALDVLKRGCSAVSAVETGIRLVEENPSDHSVGYAGLPNLLGEVELDASIMDGRTRAAGAVGALKEFPYAISVARKVMEELPHCLLVGEGAHRFAREMGFEPRELLTEVAENKWRRMMEAHAPELTRGRDAYLDRIRDFVRLTRDPERPNETVNFIALDNQGSLCCGVSTSGWAWKYPGRVGDSAVIGAGNYADDRWGACACTGRGELAIRAATARSVVLSLSQGMALRQAAEKALLDIYRLEDAYFGPVSLVAMDKHGEHVAMSIAEDAKYMYQDGEMQEPEESARVHVPRPSESQ